MAEKKHVVILGATGLIGNYLLQLFLGHDDWNVTCLLRRPLQIENDCLKVEVVDFEQHDRLGSLLKCDLLVCCLGTTMAKAGSKEAFEFVDKTLPLSFAKQAYEQGCRRMMLVSSLGASVDSGSYYTKVKGAVELELQAIPFDFLAILRPSILLGSRNEWRPFESLGKIAGQIVSPLLFGSLRRFRPIHGQTVANALYKLASSDLKGAQIFESDEIVALSER